MEPVPWQQFAARGVALLGLGAAALANRIDLLAQVIDLGLHVVAVPAERLVAGVDA